MVIESNFSAFSDGGTAVPSTQSRLGLLWSSIRRARKTSLDRQSTGNFLVFLTGADPRRVDGSDRPLFVTAGVLMLLTAGLAVYAGSNVVALGFRASAWSTLPFGVFYSLLIFFIDRSLLLGVASIRLGRKDVTQPSTSSWTGAVASIRFGRKDTVKFRKWSGSFAIRIVIAICGALLIGETLLLRFFEDSIAPMVETVKIERIGKQLAEWDTIRAGNETQLRTDLAARQTEITTANNQVRIKTDEVNCQLTGGGGRCKAGTGAVYQKKLSELGEAQTAASEAHQRESQAQTALATFLTTRDSDRTAYERARREELAGANDLLIREEGFWRLTLADDSVKVWRIVLALLLLGVDIAPLVFKSALDHTAYNRRKCLKQWESKNHQLAEARQEWENTRVRLETAVSIANRLAPEYEEFTRRHHREQLTVTLAEEQAELDVRREEIRLERDRQLRELRSRHPTPLPSTQQLGTSPYERAPASEPAQASTPDGVSQEAADDDRAGGAGDEAHPADLIEIPIDDDDDAIENKLRGYRLDGRWLLERLQWRGGYGDVWTGRDLDGREDEVAIKLMAVQNRKTATDNVTELKKIRHLWEREVQAAERLEGGHATTKHFGQILDHGQFTVGSRTFFYTVSPRYRPGSLHEVCRYRPQRTLAWCLRIVEQLLAAMVHASTAGLAHHDLKPGNVVLDGQSARIIDWGLARFYNNPVLHSASLAAGTFFYCSPEQLFRNPGWDTPLTDLFSIGGILYYLIADEAPLERDLAGAANVTIQYFELVRAGTRPTLLTDIHPELPRSVADVVDRWLSHDRALRVPRGTVPSRALVVALDELRSVRAATRDQDTLTVGKVAGPA